eukprot:15356089-Alexandrium_andersonii.AAC.1
MQGATAKSGCSIALGPASQLADNTYGGGVGFLATKECKMAPVKPITHDFSVHVRAGRVFAVWVDIGLPTPIVAFTVYGWTNAELKTDARTKT